MRAVLLSEGLCRLKTEGWILIHVSTSANWSIGAQPLEEDLAFAHYAWGWGAAAPRQQPAAGRQRSPAALNPGVERLAYSVFVTAAAARRRVNPDIQLNKK